MDDYEPVNDYEDQNERPQKGSDTYSISDNLTNSSLMHTTLTFSYPVNAGRYKICDGLEVYLEERPLQKYIDNHKEMLGWEWIDNDT